MDHVCEVCGTKAVVMVNDLRESEPIDSDDTGDSWARWEVESTHWFCHQHRRPGLRMLRPVFSIENHRDYEAAEPATQFKKASQ